MSTIRPTHTCFNDALDFIEYVIHQGELERARKLIVVHGICLAPAGPRKGEPFAHAWVEEEVQGELDVVAWQGGILEGERIWYGQPRTELFLRLRPQDFTRYTLREVYELNRRTNHYGPWEPRYEALCSREREVFREEE